VEETSTKTARVASTPHVGVSRPALRVLVLTAPIAEGHLAAARTLSEDIVEATADAEVTVCDVLPALRWPIRWLVNEAYRWQLRAAPWLFGVLLDPLAR
jgi:hypothetical protein